MWVIWQSAHFNLSIPVSRCKCMIFFSFPVVAGKNDGWAGAHSNPSPRTIETLMKLVNLQAEFVCWFIHALKCRAKRKQFLFLNDFASMTFQISSCSVRLLRPYSTRNELDGVLVNPCGRIWSYLTPLALNLEWVLRRKAIELKTSAGGEHGTWARARACFLLRPSSSWILSAIMDC